MFSIITPTYKRADLLKRAVLSVQGQSFGDWHMVVVNDSPDDSAYAEIESHMANDARITYIKNSVNSGVNYSRNAAIKYITENLPESWVILLDDDDYFSNECLARQSLLITRHPDCQWFVTNRKGSTRIAPDYSVHSYTREWLIMRTIKGDATHCISLAGLGDVRFSQSVRQGEEWIYFYQVSLRRAYKGGNFLYHAYDSTLSDGYTEAGLNFRKLSKEDRKNDLRLLRAEGKTLGIDKRLGFKLYMWMRLLKLWLSR